MYIWIQENPRFRIQENHRLGFGQPPVALSGPSRIPSLLRSETQPRGLTFYVDIDLRIGREVKPITGIFCPDRYRLNSKIDLIVYLHGHNDKAQCFEDRGVVPIDQYWKCRPFWLREEVNYSGKNIILVAPTLGQRSEAGNLVIGNGFDDYLEQVRAALITYGPYKKVQPPPMLGNVILASHSGGGSPMLNIASSGNRTVANIQQYWGFDCLYGEKDEWIKWAKSKSNKDKWLFIYYKNSTKTESRRLETDAIKQRLFNVLVSESEACNHCLIPITHFKDRLQKAPFLSNR